MADRKTDLRERVIAAAVDLLAAGGIDALTTRALAERAGTTTMTIYSRFGSRDGVLVAVLDRGFTLLADQLDAVPRTDDPLADVEAACLVYRRFARASPALYTVMFECGLREAIAQAGRSPDQAFDQLRRRVARALGEADPTRLDPATLSTWALCHGLVSLERSGLCPTAQPVDPEALLRAAINAHLQGWDTQ